ncbi:hypothetical protein [Treponema parvum]|uniref:hypothetical protein n=1 Tax=Treponema parvum TaxID=138851 RepID=UPI001AEC1516|nr:hypothetical protein [Treponema parvum]QTQ16724.1 hypothetical protein HXT04_08475 [Treponema parvum]
MKKFILGKRKRILFSIPACVLFLLFFQACGLQEYFALDPPVAYHTPDYSTLNYTEKYFRFGTASNSSSGEFIAEGTAVYYKIYTSYSEMNSHISSVNALNTLSNGTASARRVIETYSYKPVGTSAGSRTPLIANNGAQTVYIRLMSYGTEADHSSKVIIAGTEQSWKPVRYDNRRTFEFGRGANTYANYENNATPSTGDDDVHGSTAPSDNVWYVNMYAISVGRDASYTPYYSLVTWLGSVAIDAGSKNN